MNLRNYTRDKSARKSRKDSEFFLSKARCLILDLRVLLLNRLMTLYHCLGQDALDCLEITYKYPGQMLLVSEIQVKRLLEMDLVEFRHSQGWRPNWWGLAVLNWHRQRREARDRKIA